MWDVATGDEMGSFPHADPVFDVAFSADDDALLTASGDEVARVWSLAPGPWLAWGCAVLDWRGAHTDVTREPCASVSRDGVGVADVLAEAIVVDGARTEYDIITVHGVEFVLIPGGTFMMGSPAGVGDADEHPQHKLELDSFYMARTELTNAQFALYGDAHPNVDKPKGWEDERYNQLQQPVVKVSWHEANAYCDWAGFALPTEAQWEYAARAGTATAYWFGDDAEDLDRFGWYLDNSGARNHSVGKKDANAFGLYDVAGNVWEWTADANVDYTISPRAGDGLRQPLVDNVYVHIRGGSRSSDAGISRSGSRYRNHPKGRVDVLGFRPVLRPDETPR